VISMPVTIKKKEKKAQEAEEKGREETKSWIRRIEQQVDSLEKRLDAVERRLSGEEFVQPKTGKILVTESKRMQEISRKFEEEIQKIKDEILQLRAAHKTENVKGERKPLIVKVEKRSRSDTTPSEVGMFSPKEIANLERRIERLEKRKATVKVGKIEVPIEITGIVGGLIAFLIAALLFEGYRDLIISPSFVMFIGIVLILAAAIKTYLINVSQR